MIEETRIPILILMLLAWSHAGVLAFGDPSTLGPPPGTYTISPDADSIRIPFEMFRGDIRMNSTVNGKAARMLIDNGGMWDQLLFFGSEEVDALGLKREGKIQVGGPGSGDAALSDLAEGITLRFQSVDGSSITFNDQVGIITPYEKGKHNPWWGSEGQVSAQFFKHFIVEMDFDAGIITLTKPEKFRPAGKGTEVPITRASGSNGWTLPCKLTLHDGRTLDLAVTMDLGWNDPLGITTGGQHRIQVPEGLSRQPLGIAAQGQIFGYMGTVPVVQVGGFEFRDVPTTYASVEDGGSRNDEVLLGMEIFRRFHVVFDYPGRRILLHPNHSFADPFGSDQGK